LSRPARLLAPSLFLAKGAAKDDAPEIKASGDPAKDNKLSIELRPKGPGVYTSNIILKSAVDVRVMTSEL